MSASGFRYVYGPVPSRRLGRSLGIDLVGYKTCTYDCVYCQLGRTTNLTLERKETIAIEKVLAELERKLSDGDIPDYISLAGSGEPTLNSGIGDLIRKIKGLTDIPVAVLTNGSLLWMREVQDALMAADLVLPSMDAGDEQMFRYVNRPHEEISFARMTEGIAAFTKRFRGKVWLEVFLLAGVTGIPAEVEKIISIIQRIQPTRVQLNTVSRPPAEKSAIPLSPDQMLSLKRFFPGQVDIISEKGPNTANTSRLSSPRDFDILGLLRRRPCTAADVARGLGLHVTEALKRLEALLAAGKVKTVVIGESSFYATTGLEDASREC
jgi:wyosine [tRNA(Phe)-imidazoG37] synthetase (radical SAM superfamily)